MRGPPPFGTGIVTPHQGHHSLWFIAMVKNSMGIDIIKAFIRKREMPRVGLVDGCEITHPQTGKLYMFRGQINSRCQGSVFGELKKIAPGSATDFEDFFSLMPAKFCSVVKPWIGGVALFLGEKVTRQRWLGVLLVCIGVTMVWKGRG